MRKSHRPDASCSHRCQAAPHLSRARDYRLRTMWCRTPPSPAWPRASRKPDRPQAWRTDPLGPCGASDGLPFSRPWTRALIDAREARPRPYSQARIGTGIDRYCAVRTRPTIASPRASRPSHGAFVPNNAAVVTPRSIPLEPGVGRARTPGEGHDATAVGQSQAPSRCYELSHTDERPLIDLGQVLLSVFAFSQI